MATPAWMLQSLSFLLVTYFTSTEAVLYPRSGDASLQRNDDSCSSAQSISINFKFFGSTQDTIYVCTNGIISFSRGVSSYSPLPFPITSVPIVAPFWGDADTRESGNIYYRQYASGSILNTLTSDISAVYNCMIPNFQATWAFMVTWDNVPPYPRGESGNTFQAVLASDGTYSFVIYNYQTISWITGSASSTPAQVGFDAGDRTNSYAHEWSRTESIASIDTASNCGTTGRWMYRVDLNDIVPADEGSAVTCPIGYTTEIIEITTEVEEITAEKEEKKEKLKASGKRTILIISVVVPIFLIFLAGAVVAWHWKNKKNRVHSEAADQPVPRSVNKSRGVFQSKYLGNSDSSLNEISARVAIETVENERYQNKLRGVFNQPTLWTSWPSSASSTTSPSTSKTWLGTPVGI